jgi:ATP adenylyltransferase/5',5'''-P-1,P-4-tetraphosphate phosphorylase II
MHNGAKIMALAQEDLEQIQLLFHQSIGARPEIINANVRYELEIRERIVRVEEELKHQRELMLQGFEMSNKRADEFRADMSKHFEQVDKRFEQIEKHLTIITNRMDRFMFWSLGLTISAVIAIIKLT